MSDATDNRIYREAPPGAMPSDWRARMQTPAILAQLTPAQIGEVFHAQAARWYGTERYSSSMARDFGYARSTIHDWKLAPQNIHHAVILCLSAWNARQDQLAALSGVISNHAAELKKLSDEAIELAMRQS